MNPDSYDERKKKDIQHMRKKKKSCLTYWFVLARCQIVGSAFDRVYLASVNTSRAGRNCKEKNPDSKSYKSLKNWAQLE